MYFAMNEMEWWPCYESNGGNVPLFKREHAHYMRTCGYFGIDTYGPHVGLYSHILCFDLLKKAKISRFTLEI